MDCIYDIAEERGSKMLQLQSERLVADDEIPILKAAEYHHGGMITPPITPSKEDGDTISLPDVVSPDDEPLIAVLGVGYVGSHLVDSFSSRYNVIGYDVSEQRIRQLMEAAAPGGKVQFSSDPGDLKLATHYLISVPTLLRHDKSVDTSYLKDAIQTVGTHARQGSTVVIESSVAVGMTRELLGPVAKARGFYAGMSPERVDPGRTEPPMQSIPKVISGLDDVVPGSLSAIQRVYSNTFEHVVCVSRPEVAEMTKLYENCQRMMCIAYANEMADACLAQGIDPYEVSAAAATKPFGYMPFTPSLGVGGHCIPVNPFYLLCNNKFPLLESATLQMWSRPKQLASRLLESLKGRKLKGSRPKILIVGMAFKAGQSHLANSPGVELASSLSLTQETEVMWADPLVLQQAIPHVRRLADVDWRVEVLEEFDLIVVAFKQHGVDLGILEGLSGVRIERWYQTR